MGNIERKILHNIVQTVADDKKNIFYLLYYSAIEAVLILAIPLASVFIINSVLAHSSISIMVLGFIVVIIFFLTTLLQIIKAYIVEKFQQKIFVKNAITMSQHAVSLEKSTKESQYTIDKLMNYFFDITSIQKVFPVLVLDGTGLVIKVLVSLVLLLIFNPYLFSLGFFFFVSFFILVILLGKNGINYAIARSDAKHSSIFYLQNIPYNEKPSEEILQDLDKQLEAVVDTRRKMFRVMIRQLSATYVMEGVVFSMFLIVGGYLVTHGVLPLGEFVAAEIIVVSIANSLKGFVKQIDYIYDIVEGFYKIDKLSIFLREHQNG